MRARTALTERAEEVALIPSAFDPPPAVVQEPFSGMLGMIATALPVQDVPSQTLYVTVLPDCAKIAQAPFEQPHPPRPTLLYELQPVPTQPPVLGFVLEQTA